MTVASALNRKTFTGDAVTTSFATSPVVFFSSGDLDVYVVTTATGVATLLTENTHYTVTGGGTSPAVGTVSLAGGSAPYGAPAATQTLVIVRNIDILQAVDFVQNDASDAEVAEAALDRITMIAQQLSALQARSLALSDSDVSGANPTLPTPAVGKLLGWATGPVLSNYDPATSLSGVYVPTAFIATLLDDADALTARTTLGVQTSALTEDAAPDLVKDFVHVYDASASALKKDRPILLGGPSEAVALRNGYLDWTVSGNALTCAIKTLAGTDPSATDPVFALVRSATATTGAPSEVKITAANSVVVSSGSTLGTRNAIPSRVWAVLFDDAGTYRLGVINCLTTVAGAGAGSDVTAIYPLEGWGIASSTAEGGAGAADSAQTFYTGTAVTSKAYTTLGYATFESGQATAGTWATAASRKHLQRQGDPLPGQTIQVQRNDTGAMTTGTTLVPNDNTIPQITEGDQYMTQAITPTSAANVLSIDSETEASASANSVVVCLFQDATANALAAKRFNVGTAGTITPLRLYKKILSAGTAATTIRVRAGGGDGASTITFNGVGGVQQYGAVYNSYTEVTEIMA